MGDRSPILELEIGWKTCRLIIRKLFPPRELANIMKEHSHKETIQHPSRPCRPRNLHIVVRRITYDYQTPIKNNLYWFNRDPFATHFINAFQSTLPEGEPLFIEAAIDGAKIVRHRRGLSNQMEEDLKRFQQQEAFHSQQHRLWTQALVHAGYEKLEQYENMLHRLRVWFRTHISANWRLAITAAAEHYTASLAHLFIYVNQDIIKKSDFPFNSLLLYHAMEEVEHKSVCFDLNRLLSRSYLRRVISLAFVTLDLATHIYIRMRYLLKVDGLWGWKYRANVWRFLGSSGGILRGLFPKIIQYLKPTFHPWMTDEREGVERIFGDIRAKNNILPFKFV